MKMRDNHRPGEGRSTPDDLPTTIDDELTRLLLEIEDEPVPERLLKLAVELQNALARKRQKGD